MTNSTDLKFKLKENFVNKINYYPMNHNIVFFFHLICSAIMVGVIWVIQLVHYPAFHFIDKDMYASFQKFHMNSISLIVVPVMVLELATGVLLLVGNSKIF